ncbi:MAG: ABC transporter ATP-binding protein [Bacteroidales bacterium]|jgi:ABC-2 type transport system ATP-binding protein
MDHITSISINNLTKRYKKSYVDCLSQINLNIYRGEKFGLLGPNGAGKTTLISILCGIISSTGGSYQYFENGKTLNSLEIKEIIGFVPQDYAFYEELTPHQNMMYFGAFYKLSKHEILKRSEDILSVLGLSKISDKKIKTFSGGMKRRMNLALGIISYPKILFLDEPTVSADVQSKHAIIQYLNKLNSQGTTIIYTSHYLSEAENFCDRIALIDNGKLMACDYLAGLFDKHESSNLKSLFINLTGEGYRDNYV